MRSEGQLLAVVDEPTGGPSVSTQPTPVRGPNTGGGGGGSEPLRAAAYQPC